MERPELFLESLELCDRALDRLTWAITSRVVETPLRRAPIYLGFRESTAEVRSEG